MENIEMSGYTLEGPYEIEADPRIPSTSGVYIVLTRVNNKLRGIYIAAAGNVKEHVNSRNKECWMEHESDGLSIWVHSTVGMTEKERNDILFDIREDRQYKMPCRD